MWQEFMIYLARNEKIKNYFQSRKRLNQLATKFIGGKDNSDTIAKSLVLRADNINVSMFYLGEYITDLREIDKTMKFLCKSAELLAENNLDVHISVDPTQIGLGIDKEICYFNLRLLADKILQLSKNTNKKQKSMLMIDMEDASVCNDTFNFYNKLVTEQLPVAITLQAYMHRTEKDLVNVIKNGGSVRLVKGAFAENGKVALTSKKEINRAFLDMAKKMLSKEAKRKRFYPIFATHDDKMIDIIINYANENSWEKDDYEFEMLYGVRVDYQKELVKKGYKLRLYLPFGKDWWPYAIRRVGENPKNIKYLLKN